MRLGIILALCLVFALPVASDVNFSQCLLDFRNKTHPDQLAAGRDNHGHQVTEFQDATALSYTYCKDVCGTSSEPFSWSDFSQQFSAWLLPWLALLSNLPFSAHDIIDDVRSMVLTVGSPMLAAYSLAVTVINSRWLTRQLAKYQKHSGKKPIKTLIEVLTRIQQCPVKFLKFDQLETSLSPIDEEWWEDMLARLSVGHTWSISAATSVGWVIIAYIFTVVDSLTSTNNIDQSVNSAGQGVGSLWLWLLTIVVGWLQFSPKTTAENMTKADEAPLPRPVDGKQPKKVFEFRPRTAGSALRRDEYRIPPVFNYSRVLPWAADVMKVEAALRRIEEKANPSSEAEKVVSDPLLPVDASPVYSIWKCGILPNMAAASFFAFVLQWGTTGSAIIVSVFTPTVGLGCRSFSFLIYGVVSTVIWLLFVTSSILTYIAVQKARQTTEYKLTGDYEDPKYPTQFKDSLRKDRWYRVTRKSAVYLRRAAKLLAWLNAAWIMSVCFFQFTNFYDRCYCNSSVLGLGTRFGYSVIEYTMDDKRSMRKAWTGGVVVGLSSSFVFATFIALQLNPYIAQ
ncbi:hypothetical protein BDN72DRAFT_900745 [Pluteus cervinus]|uniref:Uncharacterized protein n=1 Tax=Pluteus cervinus TaxID=181527 RepID=A0ACD3AIE9_9AGAR|nr:hypothetical protein BDN72DRAFT_900745 [Pluteus cervinus]